ncbi:MAG TPA: hypothetical protein VLA92_04815, partial [Candidatus Saccharimonadales bacterium]|nr:hypothetical protein [Candidatus Saccharimonadales bacterium]
MAEKNDKPTTDKTLSHAGSAPELPHEVAKEYGLHHERLTPSKSKKSPKAEAESSSEVQQPETDLPSEAVA